MLQEFTGNLEIYLQGSYLLAYLAVYVAGLLVSFTPCVYPVLPILVAYTGAYGRGSRLKGLVLSITYVLGMSLTYTILGAFAALSGRLFGEIQSNPWTYFLVANLCILMGLAMLDVFSFSFQPDFAAKAKLTQRKGILGSFILGGVSGIIMGPCSAPVFVVLLGYVASKQNLVLGISLFFVYSIGMGTLLILVGSFTGLLAGLPKSGLWMVKIKKIFGWVFIGIGEYFLIEAGRLWF
jgi:cytochrome c-type biogenesis protein